MHGSPEQNERYTKRYCWPSSKLGEEEMKLLYEEKIRTGKPITWLVREAVVERYGKVDAQQCRAKSEQ